MTAPAAALTHSDLRALLFAYLETGEEEMLEILLEGLEEAHGVSGWERKESKALLKYARRTWEVEKATEKKVRGKKAQTAAAARRARASVVASVAKDLAELVDQKIQWSGDEEQGEEDRIDEDTEMVVCALLDNDFEVIAAVGSVKIEDYQNPKLRLLVENQTYRMGADWRLDDLESQPVNVSDHRSILLDLVR